MYVFTKLKELITDTLAQPLVHKYDKRNGKRCPSAECEIQ